MTSCGPRRSTSRRTTSGIARPVRERGREIHHHLNVMPDRLAAALPHSTEEQYLRRMVRVTHSPP